MKTKGFTLIELILIVILISAGMSFFVKININEEHNNIKNLSSQLKKYDNSISAFYIKYGSLPGDIKKTDVLNLSKNNTDGNENHIIEDLSQQRLRFEDNLKLNKEVASFWIHLYNSKLLETEIKSLPFIDFSKSSIVAFSDIGENYYHLSVKNIEDNGEITTMNSFTPNQAFLIDRKIDDSLPFSGKIRVYGGDRINVKTKNNINKKCADGDEYFTSNKEVVCQLIYKLDI